MAALPENQDLKSILEHVRGQFQYHAGQRLNAIRYYFVAYAIFAAAYVGTLTTNSTNIPGYVQLVLSGTALIVTLGFWGLDVRNVQLVHIDENGLKEIEKLVSEKYQFSNFEMTKKWDDAGWRIFRYQFIVNVLFGVIAIISAAATFLHFKRFFCP